MNVSDELMEHEIRAILYSLDIPIEQKSNSDGWISLCSPLREDKKPSFRLNISSGAWMDHGTGDKGDIITLVAQMTGKDSAEAVQFVKEQLTTDRISRPVKRPNKQTKQSSVFWNQERKKMILDANRRLKEEPEHQLIRMIANRDKVPYPQLKKYRCGILHYLNDDWLVFPYSTGAQLYRRADGKKIIRMIKGSKPSQSFYGVKQCNPSPVLNITKSPRECMALDYYLNSAEMVIGLCTGEHVTSFEANQAAILAKALKSGVRSVKIFLDTVTEQEKNNVRVLAGAIQAIANQHINHTIRIAIH